MPRRPNTRPTSIYWLFDMRTGIPFYCGKTVQKIEYRLNAHMWDARRHPDRPVYTRILECGEHIQIALMESVPVGEDWVSRERYWISVLRRLYPDCVNVSDGGDGTPGHIPSEATRILMSEKMKGRTFTPETIAKMSARMKGNPIRKGKRLSPEQSARISAQRTGKKRGPQSPEHRAAIGAAQRGKVITEETKAALRAAWTLRRLRPVSAETRVKLSVAGKGRKRSDQTRENMRAAWVERRAKSEWNVDKS